MSQINSQIMEERINFYSKFNVKELEIQLLEEKSFHNRNIIRKIIRNKRKEKDDTEKTNKIDKAPNGTNQEIENLKTLLSETTDFFEQCKIRSSIMDLQKREKNCEPEKKKLLKVNDAEKGNSAIEELIKKKTQVGESKQLVFDEITPNNNIMSTVLNVNDSLELLWIMPFKILSSIEYIWTINEKTISTSQTSHCVNSFDGKCASLKIENLNIPDNGLYKLAIHSQRLRRKCLKFNIIVNSNKHQQPSTVIDDFVEQTEKPKIDSGSTPVPQYESKPKLLHKNRFNRHKTMIGQEMLEDIKNAQNKEGIQSNKNINESSNLSPLKQIAPLRRFNRSATSAKDIILMFCKLNTEEYENYGVCVENLSSSWTDGLAFCALIHHFHPEAFDFSKLNKLNHRFNFELAFNTAEKYADICPLLDIDDMMIMEKPDWKCIFTYVQCFYKTFRTHPLNKLKTMPIS